MLKLDQISYSYAEKTLFSNLSLTLNKKKYGLVGFNGIGKSTLAQIIIGNIEPDSGTIYADKIPTYLPQFETPMQQTVDEYLANVQGSSSQYYHLLENINDQQNLNTLSGGEWMRVRLAKLVANDPNFVILDEPTNNLDEQGKNLILKFIQDFNGGVLVISHDRELLNSMDEILELTNKGISSYGGNFDFYQKLSTEEKQTQLENYLQSKKILKKNTSERNKKIEKQSKRSRNAEKNSDKLGLPKIIIGKLKRKAQTTTGKIKTNEDKRVEESQLQTDQLFQELKINPFIRLDFVGASVPKSKIIFDVQDLNIKFDGTPKNLWDENLNFTIRGAERWLVRGLNGSGKSTLIKLLLNDPIYTQYLSSGQIKISNCHSVYLDQKYTLLNLNQSILDNFEHSRFNIEELRNELAFYGFTNEKVFQITSTLSGGEKLKLALAKMFLGGSIPEVIILDEPTNNLDLQSITLLENALEKFCGSLIVITHDDFFAKAINVTHEILIRKS